MALTKRQRKEKLKRGGQKRIAMRLGLSESTVSQVMNRKTQTLQRDTILRVQIAIAEEIGEPLEEVFGDAVAA
jgi:predicted XRE-type DNA-binding protein